MTTGAPRDRGAVGLALAIVGLGVYFAVETAAIPSSPIYARVGPTVFPIAVAAGLVALGLVLLRAAWRGDWRAETDASGAPARIDVRAALLFLAGLLAAILLLKPAGFVVAATVLFAVVARAFGSVRLVRDLVSGAALAVAAYEGFARGLGVDLPAGVLAGLL